jgi:hypothetical protein
LHPYWTRILLLLNKCSHLILKKDTCRRRTVWLVVRRCIAIHENISHSPARDHLALLLSLSVSSSTHSLPCNSQLQSILRQREDRGRAKMQLKRSCARMLARPPPTRATRRLGARRDLLGRRRRALGGLRRPPPTGPQRAPQAAADGRSEGSADAADGSSEGSAGRRRRELGELRRPLPTGAWRRRGVRRPPPDRRRRARGGLL